MFYRNSISKQATYPFLATATLGIFLTMQSKLGIGESAIEPEGGVREVPQSTIPVRGGSYVDDYAELNALREGVTTLPSGVQYEVLKEGSGKQPSATDTVIVHYKSMLATGVEFGNTYAEDEPARLQFDQYIVPGLKEALLLMKEGDEWRVTIPARMGFTGGKFLRKRDLIYEITLLSIVDEQDDEGAPEQSPEKNP